MDEISNEVGNALEVGAMAGIAASIAKIKELSTEESREAEQEVLHLALVTLEMLLIETMWRAKHE